MSSFSNSVWNSRHQPVFHETTEGVEHASSGRRSTSYGRNAPQIDHSSRFHFECAHNKNFSQAKINILQHDTTCWKSLCSTYVKQMFMSCLLVAPGCPGWSPYGWSMMVFPFPGQPVCCGSWLRVQDGCNLTGDPLVRGEEQEEQSVVMSWFIVDMADLWPTLYLLGHCRCLPRLPVI